MMPDLFNSTTLPVLEQVVNFSQARHGVLAGNIANLDTPGYKTRDLSPQVFQQNLKQAIQESRRAPSAGNGPTTAAGVSPSAGSHDRRYDALRNVQESMTSILRHDHADVSLEKQIAEISKNHAQHNLAVNLMSAQFRLLRAAISERAV